MNYSLVFPQFEFTPLAAYAATFDATRIFNRRIYILHYFVNTLGYFDTASWVIWASFRSLSFFV